MAKSRPDIKYVIEPTSGRDNNCAFHAFALGFFKPEVLDQVEAVIAKDGLSPDAALEKLINKVAPKLGVPATWDAVKKRALQLRRDDEQGFQEKLGGVLRELAIELTSDEPAKTEHCLELEHGLLSIYEKYPSRVAQDDIFSRHDFIETAFKEFKAKSASTDVVKAWWRTVGFDHYQAEMKKPGAMAGDDQLVPIARYCRVTLRVIAPRFDGARPFTLSSANGSFRMPKMTFAHAKELVNRDMVTGPIKEKEFDAKTPLAFKPISEKELNANLSKVPNFENVDNYLRTTKFVPYKGKAGYHATVPAEWQKDAECMEQLILRNVVFKDKKNGYVFSADNSKPAALTDTLSRIDEVLGKDALIEAWQDAYRDAPVVTLTNPEAKHWSNTIITSDSAVAEEAAKKAEAERIAAESATKAATENAIKAAAAKAEAASVAAAKAEAEKAATEKAAKIAAEKASVTAKEKTKAVAQDFITSTLKYLETTAALPEESKWSKFVSTAVAQAADGSIAKDVKYALAEADRVMHPAATSMKVAEIEVSKELQEKLDEQVAKELQQQEYARYKGISR